MESLIGFLQSISLLRLFWLLYWLTSLTFCVSACLHTAKNLSRKISLHIWSILFLQSLLLLNLLFNFTADLNWDRPLLSDATRIGAMITTSLMIGAFPLAFDTGDAGPLNSYILRFFIGSGIVFALHYLVSSAFFFSLRYDGSYKYFDGYRYIPAYSVFILHGISVAYTCLSIFLSKSTVNPEGVKILKTAVKRAGTLFPLVFVFDLVRYFFPFLWKFFPQERLFLTPLAFIIINVYLQKYIHTHKQGDAETVGYPGDLSERETQVTELLCKGMSYKEIACSLHISVATVQTHIMHIYRKTGVNRKEELILRYPIKMDID